MGQLAALAVEDEASEGRGWHAPRVGDATLAGVGARWSDFGYVRTIGTSRKLELLVEAMAPRKRRRVGEGGGRGPLLAPAPFLAPS